MIGVKGIIFVLFDGFMYELVMKEVKSKGMFVVIMNIGDMMKI